MSVHAAHGDAPEPPELADCKQRLRRAPLLTTWIMVSMIERLSTPRQNSIIEHEGVRYVATHSEACLKGMFLDL